MSDPSQAGEREVVGLDLSLTATGLATRDGVWTIRTRSAVTLAGRVDRLGKIGQDIFWRTPRGALVMVEGPSFGSSTGQAHLRAGLWWVIVAGVTRSGMEAVEVPPKTLKKFATGSGNANKPAMRDALFRRTGMDLDDDNQVDAWWLRQAGLHLIGDPDAIPLPKSQLDAIRGVTSQLSS